MAALPLLLSIALHSSFRFYLRYSQTFVSQPEDKYTKCHTLGMGCIDVQNTRYISISRPAKEFTYSMNRISRVYPEKLRYGNLIINKCIGSRLLKPAIQ